MIPFFVFANKIRATTASISFVASSASGYVAAASISSPTSPAGIADDDGLFAILMHRGVVTAPAGWSLVDTQAVTGAVTQSVSIYRKDTVTSADASTAFVWTQASGSRMGLNYIVLRSSSGVMTVASPTGKTSNTVSSNTVNNCNVLSLTATMDGEMFILAGTSVTTSGTNTWAAPAGATLRSTAATTDNRVVSATQARDSGESNSLPFTFSSSVAISNEFASITIRVQPV